MALGNLIGLRYNDEQLFTHYKSAVRDRSSAKQVRGRHSVHSVRFLPCMRYNYCHAGQSCCTDPDRLPVSVTTEEELTDTHVKVRQC